MVMAVVGVFSMLELASHKLTAAVGFEKGLALSFFSGCLFLASLNPSYPPCGKSVEQLMHRFHMGDLQRAESFRIMPLNKKIINIFGECITWYFKIDDHRAF